MPGRVHLHQLVDALPDDALQQAEQALKYWANPVNWQRTLQQVRERVTAKATERLKTHQKGFARRPGRAFIGDTSGSTTVTPGDGNFESSMPAWDNGPITYRLRGFRGHLFEIVERLELVNDGTKLVLTQRVVGPDGAEQVLTANMPLPGSATE